MAGILSGAIAPILEEYSIECLLFGGQISRSCDLMATTLQNSLAFLPSLRRIDVISDFDNATFNGLKSMF